MTTKEEIEELEKAFKNKKAKEFLDKRADYLKNELEKGTLKGKLKILSKSLWRHISK